MKIVFFGTPDFVIPVAQSLLNIVDCELRVVVTNPDRPFGRNQILTPSPIKQWAINHQIKVIDSDTVIRIAVSLKKLSPDLGILAAYGKIIPQEVIDLFPQGILVIHPSLLPRYRGASPIQAAILSGGKETGVSIIKMDEKMDHGPMIAQFKEKILETDTAETLTKRLFEKTVPCLIRLISRIDLIKPIPQNHSLATFTKLISKEDGKIDWNWDPEKIERFIRAMTPWPGAWTFITMRQSSNETIKQMRLKILKAHVGASQDVVLQKQDNVLKNPAVKLVLDLVQLEGKNPVPWSEFQKGYPEAKFTRG